MSFYIFVVRFCKQQSLDHRVILAGWDLEEAT